MPGVDKKEKGRGIGEDLLSDAMRRALQAAKIIEARARRRCPRSRSVQGEA
jgi:hypothetical protein